MFVLNIFIGISIYHNYYNIRDDNIKVSLLTNSPGFREYEYESNRKKMITFLATIIVISVIVLVHELGHFMLAKSCGVLVEKFSIGFPPTLFKKKVGETEYAIGAIPFGGYVKMSGETPREDNAEPSNKEFRAKPIHSRALILAAGSIMNLILGILLFWAVLAFHGTGELSPDPIIGDVMKDSPADSAGLSKGDRIISIDSVSISDWEGMASKVHSMPGKKALFTIERRDSTFIAAIIPTPTEIKSDSGSDTIGLVGIRPVVNFVPRGVFRAVPGSLVLFGDILGAMAQFVVKIFSGGIRRGDIGGPVMIAKMAGTTAQSGWAAFLFFLAALSVNLGVLNLFPFPVLDGGQLVYLAIEAIRKKPMSLRVKLIVQQIGFLLLLLLMIYITISDIFFVFGK